MDHSRLRFDMAGRRDWKMTSSASQVVKTAATVRAAYRAGRKMNLLSRAEHLAVVRQRGDT
ncbi:hypothetical protein IG631_07733 [Alternaria alternata]|nr:hypothetical protein IG631_07733 [Alternaria alternata]